jgi:hypothetical protein
MYKIKFYDSDSGGMRTVHTKTVEFNGTYKEAVKFVKGERSPWGFNYRVGSNENHGVAVIKKTTHEIASTEHAIGLLEKKLRRLERKQKNT